MKRNLFIGKPVSFNVMLKPAGPACNLNCIYCYYLEKNKLYNSRSAYKMSHEVLEIFIKQYIKIQEVPAVTFVWQGGEPTLLGIEYYEKAFELQKKYAGEKKVENVFQTNGTLLNDDWCKFFRKHNMLIGVSIDGPEKIHNKYRNTHNGKPTFKKVMAGIELLKKHHVEFNTLSVVNNYNVDHPLEVYHFLKDIGSGFMQFIPIVERIAKNDKPELLKLVSPEYMQDAILSGWSVDGKKYGDFLISIFDEWVRNDVGKYYVQIFDVTLANWVGANPGLCVYTETCGDALVMEYNGDIYSCDHYVYPENKLENIFEDSLLEMVNSEKQLKFGEKKLNSLPNQCINCEYRFTCHGECPKNRISVSKDGEPGLNYLCEGLFIFFKHVHPYMQFMAEELKKEQPPANVMQWVKKIDFRNSIRNSSIKQNTPVKSKTQKILSNKIKIGRNDPCICGSGKKYKNCCLNKY